VNCPNRSVYRSQIGKSALQLQIRFHFERPRGPEAKRRRSEAESFAGKMEGNSHLSEVAPRTGHHLGTGTGGGWVTSNNHASLDTNSMPSALSLASKSG
jgi:hypothetical protein